jgi:hypothetical protein
MVTTTSLQEKCAGKQVKLETPSPKSDRDLNRLGKVIASGIYTRKIKNFFLVETHGVRTNDCNA